MHTVLSMLAGVTISCPALKTLMSAWEVSHDYILLLPSGEQVCGYELMSLLYVWLAQLAEIFCAVWRKQICRLSRR